MTFADRPVLRQLAASASLLVVDKVLRLVVGVFVNIWIARYLGPSGFGLLNFTQSIIVVLSAFATLGLTDLLVRDLVHRPERRRELVASTFALRLVGACFAAAFALLVVVLLRPDFPLAWLLVCLLAAGQFAQAMDVVDIQYQVVGRITTIVIVRSSTFLAFSAFKVGAIMLGAPIWAFAALLSLELSIVAIVMFFRARRDGLGFGLSNSCRLEGSRLLKETMPLLARLLVTGIYLRADQIIIGRMLGDTELGVYSAATRLSEIWYLVTTAVLTAVVPRLAETFNMNVEDYNHQLLRVVRGLVWASVIVAVVTMLAGPGLINLLYGERFAAAGPLLSVFAWANVFGTLGQAASAWFVNTRLVRYAFFQALGAAAINILLCLTLIPTLGLLGGAIAALACQCFAGFLGSLFATVTRPIFRLQCRALLGI